MIPIIQPKQIVKLVWSLWFIKKKYNTKGDLFWTVWITKTFDSYVVTRPGGRQEELLMGPPLKAGEWWPPWVGDGGNYSRNPWIPPIPPILVSMFPRQENWKIVLLVPSFLKKSKPRIPPVGSSVKSWLLVSSFMKKSNWRIPPVGSSCNPDLLCKISRYSEGNLPRMLVTIIQPDFAKTQFWLRNV